MMNGNISSLPNQMSETIAEEFPHNMDLMIVMSLYKTFDEVS